MAMNRAWNGSWGEMDLVIRQRGREKGELFLMRLPTCPVIPFEQIWHFWRLSIDDKISARPLWPMSGFAWDLRALEKRVQVWTLRRLSGSHFLITQKYLHLSIVVAAMSETRMTDERTEGTGEGMERWRNGLKEKEAGVRTMLKSQFTSWPNSRPDLLRLMTESYEQMSAGRDLTAHVRAVSSRPDLSDTPRYIPTHDSVK